MRKGTRTGAGSTWSRAGRRRCARTTDRLRQAVSVSGVWATLGLAVLLPFVLDVGRTYLFSEICIYAVIALSLTILTGWAGQLSLGQFGLVAVGSLMASHLGNSVPLPLLLLFGGAVTAAVAIVIGLPALRMPGLFLAVSTLGFAYFMQQSVLPTACWTLPVLHKTLCTGLPAGSQVITHPEFGLSLQSTGPPPPSLSLGVLVLSVLAVRTSHDHRRGPAAGGVAGRRGHGRPPSASPMLGGGGALGVRPLGLHGRLRRRPLSPSRRSGWSTDTFDPTVSFLIISMVVVGGLSFIPPRSSAPSTSRGCRRSSAPTRRSNS